MPKKMTEAEMNAAGQAAIDAATPLLNTDAFTKKPNRSKAKSPAKRTTKTTKRTAKTSESVRTELVHNPVSGSGINAQVRGDIGRSTNQQVAESLAVIAEQNGTVLISQANKRLDKQVAIDQGLGLETELVQEQNATKHESIATQAMKTQQQATRTSIEGVRLQVLNVDLAGEAALLPYREEAWNIKALEAEIENNGARSLLEPRKEFWSLKAELAEVGLQKLRNKVEKDIAELEAPIDLQITQHDYDL